MSSARLVDWGLAERTAGAVIGGIGPFGQPPPVAAEDAYGAAEVADACAGAIEAAATYAGLGAVDAPPEPELIDRRAGAGRAGDPRRRRHSHRGARVRRARPPRPLAPVARSVVGAAAAAEAGVAVGYAARRVLGQYDVALIGPERPARLLFVAENLASARRSSGRTDASSCGGWRCTRPRT